MKDISGLQKKLEMLMKSLTRYIEEKREIFPRLYFLSNEQIIEMCGTIEDMSILERCFVKMFEGINKLVIVFKEHELTEEERIELHYRIEQELEDLKKPVLLRKNTKPQKYEKPKDKKKMTMTQRVEEAIT